jgi:hypothetical protein
MWRAAIALAVVLAAAAITTGVVMAVRANPLPGLQTGSAPWPAEEAHLRERLEKLGLPVLRAEALAFHIHQHLDVFVEGRRVTVPADIGINVQQQFLTVLHTHDNSGIIHVESPTERTFALGQLFDVWGVRLTSSCLGGYCTDGQSRVRVYVGGQVVGGDPRAVPLEGHDEIVVAYGTPAQLPKPIPARYPFPAGL